MLVLGPLVIPILTRLKFGQFIRDQGPKRHQLKAGTPTMGGMIFLAGLVLATLVVVPGGPAHFPDVYLLLAVTLAFGLVGFADDYLKVVARQPLGLRARSKLVWQVALGLAFGFLSVHQLGVSTALKVPWTNLILELSVPAYLGLVVLMMLATVNAVNLADGLDGLAAGAAAIVLVTYALTALALKEVGAAFFGLALAGACAGFLRFNYHPARVFMGDTGSHALGGAVAGLAVLTKTELLLPLIGGLFVVEALSVIVQVGSFHLFGKRVLLMSPIHHHFELRGWPETTVVTRFWLVAAVFALLGFLAGSGWKGVAD